MNKIQNFIVNLFIVGLIILIIGIAGMYYSVEDTVIYNISGPLAIAGTACICMATIGTAIFPMKD